MENLINNFKRKPWMNIFTVYLRFLIGAAFVYSSIVKTRVNRFISIDGSDFPINTMAHFFETIYQSGLYWQFIGASQLVAGCLLMTQRFSTMGALIFFPIILNIFVITLSYDFRGTPIITGLMLLANTFLLLWDYSRLKYIFSREIIITKLKESYTHAIEKRPFWIYIGFALFVTTVYIRIENINIKYWFWACFFEGLIGFAYYMFKKEKRLSTIHPD